MASRLRAALGFSLLFLTLPLSASSLLLRDVVTASALSKGGAALRARHAEADLELLRERGLRPGAVREMRRELIANLFDDVQLPVTLTRLEVDRSGSFVWSGHVDGEPGSSVSIAVNGAAVHALFSLRSHTYSIRTLGTQQEVRELAPAAYPDEIAPVVIPAEARTLSEREVVADGTPTMPVIEVLVAYTNVVRDAYGSDAAVQSLVSNGVSATNTAYRNSGVNAQLRLVGTMLVQYDDRTADFMTTLTRLRSNDGYLDDVLARRSAVGADAVSLLVYAPTDNNCGLGYQLTPSSSTAAGNAFNVVRADCAVDNLSFPHELGHNFGLAHDRAHSGTTPSYPYAYGYQDTTNLFRDIMAYDCVGGCRRLQYFSNPDILINGRPLGVAYTLPDAADATRALNANVVSVAAYLPTSVADVTYTFTDNPLVAGVTVVRAVHVTEIRNAIDSMRARAGLPKVAWTDPVLAGGLIKATHVSQMRAALSEALLALGYGAPSFTGDVLASGPVKALDLQELRNAVR